MMQTNGRTGNATRMNAQIEWRSPDYTALAVMLMSNDTANVDLAKSIIQGAIEDDVAPLTQVFELVDRIYCDIRDRVLVTDIHHRNFATMQSKYNMANQLRTDVWEWFSLKRRHVI